MWHKIQHGMHNHPGFAHLRHIFRNYDHFGDFPPLSAFQSSHVQFVLQDEPQGLNYEQLIFSKQQVPTRLANTHDFLNMMIWHAMPQCKTTCNALQVKYAMQETTRRSKEQNFLTHFDEMGAILFFEQEKDASLFKTMQFKALFQQEAPILYHCIPFGHALLEQLLNPFIGLTAKALVFNGAPPSDLDTFLHNYLLENQHILQDTRNYLLPLPILGIPGWYQNQNDEFYANTKYFKTSRKY